MSNKDTALQDVKRQVLPLKSQLWSCCLTFQSVPEPCTYRRGREGIGSGHCECIGACAHSHMSPQLNGLLGGVQSEEVAHWGHAFERFLFSVMVTIVLVFLGMRGKGRNFPVLFAPCPTCQNLFPFLIFLFSLFLHAMGECSLYAAQMTGRTHRNTVLVITGLDTLMQMISVCTTWLMCVL